MNPTETLQNLDENFLFLLHLIKNHHQTFADRPDKDVLLQAWLHKLCIETDYEGIDQKRNRNVYLCKLLNCLQMRRLTGPFLQRPRPGKLKQWPLPMPALEEPQWVRDLDAASKKTTRIGGKDLKTYISTKRLDNNRGLCALLSVSVADERGEPGFKRLAMNQGWEDVEKEFVGMEAQIAAEPPSPRKLPEEKIIALEEELQGLEARIPPEPKPLSDILPTKAEKKMPSRRGPVSKSRTDLKRAAKQPEKTQKPRLTKPTPPKHKEVKTPSFPISPDQAAFNALEETIKFNVGTATPAHPKKDAHRKIVIDRNLELLTKQRELQLEKQRQLEAELFAKTPSPARREEDELEPTPPLVKELRMKQEARILRQRAERLERQRLEQLAKPKITPPPPIKTRLFAQTPSPEQRQVESEISQRQMEAQMRQQQIEQSFITPPRKEADSSPHRRATPTPPTPEMPAWIRKKYAGKEAVHIPSTEEVHAEQERRLKQQLKPKTAPHGTQQTRKTALQPKTAISRPKTQPPNSDVLISSSKTTTQLRTTTVKQSAYGLKPPATTSALMRQPSSTRLKGPAQTSGLRTPATKPSAYGFKPQPSSLMRQPSGTSLKPPSLARQPSGTSLKPPSLARQPSGIGLKAPSQTSGLRTPAPKPTQAFARQASSTGLKPPSQLRPPKRGS